LDRKERKRGGDEKRRFVDPPGTFGGRRVAERKMLLLKVCQGGRPCRRRGPKEQPTPEREKKLTCTGSKPTRKQGAHQKKIYLFVRGIIGEANGEAPGRGSLGDYCHRIRLKRSCTPLKGRKGNGEGKSKPQTNLVECGGGWKGGTKGVQVFLYFMGKKKTKGGECRKARRKRGEKTNS